MKNVSPRCVCIFVVLAIGLSGRMFTDEGKNCITISTLREKTGL